MRKRNPVVLIFIAAAVLLGGLLILASSRRATVEGPGTVATTVPLPTFAPTASTARSAATTAGRAGATPTTAAASTGAASTGATSGKADATTSTTRAAGKATTAVTAPRGMRSVSASALPAEARATLALVTAGGPFPYDQDGAVFQNREGVLPKKAAGYYHEYTVETPGSGDRGARRVVTGAAGERYYTDDHYATFRFVVA